MASLFRRIGMIVCTWLSAAAGAAETQDQVRQRQLDRCIQTFINKQRIPGLAVVLVQPATAPSQQVRCYGFADIHKRVPVSKSTLFPLASLTKLFTAQSIILLSKQGKLKLDDPITKWLADAPHAWSEITIRHLLTHTSGLPCELSNGKSWGGSIARLEMQSRVSAGSQAKYNNVGYVLLGRIVERVAGTKLGSFFERNIFAPLEMKQATIPEQRIPNGLAMGYLIDKDKLSACRILQDWRSMGGSGGIVASPEDLRLWAQRLSASAPETWQEGKLAGGKPVPYTCGGWETCFIGQTKAFQKQGNITAYSCAATFIPEKNLTLVLLANAGNCELKKLSCRLIASVDEETHLNGIGIAPISR